MVDRTLTTAINVDSSGAVKGAGEFVQAMDRVKVANDEAGRATERLTVVMGDTSRVLARLRREFDPAAAAAAKLKKEQANLTREFAAGRVEPAEYQRLMDGLAKKYDTVGQAEQARMRAMDAMRAKYDPMFASQRRYEDALRDLNEAQAAGVAVGDNYRNALDRIERELNPASIAARELATAEEQLARRARDLVEATNPMARAQRLYNDEVREADELLARQAITQEQHTAAIARARQGLDAADAAARRAAGGTQLTAHQMQQLGFQINDVVAQLASGSNPLMILGQQGPQITQVFGGLRATLARIPVGLGLIGAGVAGVGAAAYMAGSRFNEIAGQTRRLESIARTLNPQLRGMTAELRQMTLAMEAQGVQRPDAIAAVEQLARARALQVGMLRDVAALGVDLGATTGEGTAKAIERIAEAFKRGAVGVRELDEELNFLKPDEAAEIDRLARTGKRAEALAMALDLLKRKFGGEAARLVSEWDLATNKMYSAWSTMWEKIAKSPGVGNAMSNISQFFSALMRAATPTLPEDKAPAQSLGGLDQQISKLQKELADAKKKADELLAKEPDILQGLTGDTLERQARVIDELENRLTRLLELRRELARGNHTLRANKSGLTDEEQKRVDENIKAYERETDALNKSIVERQIALAKLQAYEATYLRTGSDAEAREAAALAERKARDDLTRAIRDENEALDDNIKGNLAVASAYARSTAEGLRAEAMVKALNDARQSGVDAADRARRYLEQDAGAAFIAGRQALNKLRDDVANQQPIVFGSSLSASAEQDARRGLEADDAYREQLAKAEAARNDRLVAGIKAQRDEYEKLLRLRDINAAKIATNQDFRALQNETELIEREGRLIGATNDRRDTEIGLLQLRQTLIERGYSGKELDAEYDRLGKLIERRAKLTEETRKATEEFEKNKQAILDGTQIMTDAFYDLVANGTQFTDVIKQMSKALLQLGYDLLVVEPLKKWMSDTMNAGAASGGGTNFWNVASSLVQTGLSMWSGNVAGAAAGAAGTTTATAGGFGGAPVLPVEVVQLHKGGIVGQGGEPRTVPASVFVDAPRMHRGGIRPGERAVIMEDGEEVLTANNPRHRRNFRSAGHTVNMYITTPDASSFRQSQGQLSASIGRAMTIAARRNG